VVPVLSLISLWPLAASLPPPVAPPEAEEIVVELTPVSAFDISVRGDFIGGQDGGCTTEPWAGVTRYPAFESSAPLYGAVRFPGLPTEEGAEARVFCAIDESQGTGTGYDRLYLDLDRDLDLANGEPLELWKYPPAGAKRRWDDIVQQACFDTFEVPCDYGEAGILPVEVLPRLVIEDYEGTIYRSLDFIGTRAWVGEIEVGGNEFDLRLGHAHSAVRRFDDPFTKLLLTKKSEKRSRIGWWGGDQVNALHEIDGTLFAFTPSPTGDELTARPYAGAFGELAIGAGGRELSSMTVYGSLRGEEHSVAVGEMASSGWPGAVERCRIPVGDYLPASLSIRFGDLSIHVSDNYHVDGGPRKGTDRRVYGIEIREDRPFTLDFHTEPTVLFASPERELRLKPGDTLEVAAVLVDPELDIMIRGLDDNSQQVEETVDYGDGETRTYTTALSLDPRVIVTRKNGEKLAEGDMPFG